RGEGAGNFRLPELSYNPGHGEGRFLYRVLPYVYWHPTDYLDIHLEGQGYGYAGSNQYDGHVSLYQGYMEGKLPGSDLLSLKIGRQELVYGCAFILGANGFFQGLTYDAARLRVKPSNALTIDLLGGWYSHPWSDGVNGYLTGGYASYAIKEGTVLEAYGLVDTGSSDHHHGEHTNIWGLRGTAKFGPLSLEIEPVYESGRTFNSAKGNNDTIDAWGGHADMTFETEVLGRKNTFFASYAYGSGSKDAANGMSSRREFRNPANDTSLTGDMSLIGDLSGVDVGDFHASGLQIFNLGWGVELIKDLTFSTAARYFYANQVPDGFSRRVGLETDFTLTYAVNDNLSLILGYDRFFTGRFFRDASGSDRDMDYGYAMLQFDISKTKARVMVKK
ncbi:MAG: alginate export family protein, partial [Desulfuromonadales bacterium]|nr:alginate export family protein [Desulfuromonadales bacterium]